MDDKKKINDDTLPEIKITKQKISDEEEMAIQTTKVMSKEEIRKALEESKIKGRKQAHLKTKVAKNTSVDDTEDSEQIKKKNKKLSKEDKKIKEYYEGKKKKGFFSLFSRKKDNDEEANFKENNKMLNAVRFLPDIEVGLKRKDVEQRIREDLTNKSKNTSSKTYWKIFYTNVLTFFNFLLLAIFIALIIVGNYSDCFFMVIAVLNTTIGVVTEIRAKRIVDKLKLVTAPSARVIRDGEVTEVSTENVVLDDIMFLASGNQIGADAIVKSGSIEVNESLLTGESLPVKKNVNDLVLAGSFVVSGSCTCQVERVGNYCYASHLQEQAKKYSKPKSELVRSLNALIKGISFVIIPVGIILFWMNFMASPQSLPVWGTTSRVAYAIARTSGAVIGMIPAGLFLLTSIALTAGVIRLAKFRTVVQDLYSIEMLARTNVLCLDKTGTLTDGTMKVNEVVLFDNSKNIDDIMGSYLSSFQESNQTSIALANVYPFNSYYRAIATIPFSSARKFSAVSFENNGTYLLGAPEYIYKGNDEEIKNLVSSRQKQGYRVMMLCKSDSYIKDGMFNGNVKPVAIFILIDHIRKEAFETIKWFNENGVEIKIISGDNPYTASNIASHVGVIGADKCVSLEGVSIQETKELASRFTVFGRVSPEQKAALIQSLKVQGKVVAMTGDGVNDILAMKNADCSIAMAGGADAAKSVAHLVLLDSNFASMPKVVEEGRRVINNVQRSSSLFLMKTIFTAVLSFIVIAMSLFRINNPVAYPFQPSQLFLIEMFGIGVPSFFLALQPDKNLIKGHFMKNTFFRALPGSIAMLGVVGLVNLLNMLNVFEFDPNLPHETVSLMIVTLQVLGLMVVSLSMLYGLCKPFNLYRFSLLTAMIAGTIVCVFLIPKQFINIDIFSLNKICVLVLLILCFSLPILTLILDYGFSFLRDDNYEKLKHTIAENNRKIKEFFTIKKKQEIEVQPIEQSQTLEDANNTHVQDNESSNKEEIKKEKETKKSKSKKTKSN